MALEVGGSNPLFHPESGEVLFIFFWRFKFLFIFATPFTGDIKKFIDKLEEQVQQRVQEQNVNFGRNKKA